MESQSLLRPQSIRNQMTVSKCLDLDDISINDKQQDQYRTAFFNKQNEGFQAFNHNLQFKSFKYPSTYAFYSLQLCQKLFICFSSLKTKEFTKYFFFLYNYGQIFLQVSYGIDKLLQSLTIQQQTKNDLKLCSIIMQCRGVLILIKVESVLRIVSLRQKPTQFLQLTQHQKSMINKILQNEKLSNKQKIINEFSQNIVAVLKDLKQKCNKNLQLLNKQEKVSKAKLQIVQQIKKLISLSKDSEQFYEQAIKTDLKKILKAAINQSTNQVYKFVYQLVQREHNKNVQGRLGYQLLFLLSHIKIYNPNLFKFLFNFYQSHKKQIILKQRSLNNQLFKNYKIRINKVYRSSLPKITLLFKHSGFISILMFLQQADIEEISSQIFWCKNASTNLKKYKTDLI